VPQAPCDVPRYPEIVQKRRLTEKKIGNKNGIETMEKVDLNAEEKMW
jgi:hypothetical protein